MWQRVESILFLPICIAILLVTPTSAPSIPLSQAQAETEYKLKSAFLFNFIRFTKRAPRTGDIEVCIIADEIAQKAFGGLDGKTVNQRKISISPRTLDFESGYDDCEVIFVSQASREEELRLIAQTKDRRQLTIGNSEGFCEAGGIIQLFVVDARVRFKINLKKAKEEQIRFNPKMLQLASSIIDGAE